MAVEASRFSAGSSSMVHKSVSGFARTVCSCVCRLCATDHRWLDKHDGKVRTFEKLLFLLSQKLQSSHFPLLLACVSNGRSSISNVCPPTLNRTVLDSMIMCPARSEAALKLATLSKQPP
eukprot:2347074-Amphidinium_carterae.2